MKTIVLTITLLVVSVTAFSQDQTTKIIWKSDLGFEVLDFTYFHHTDTQKEKVVIFLSGTNDQTEDEFDFTVSVFGDLHGFYDTMYKLVAFDLLNGDIDVDTIMNSMIVSCYNLVGNRYIKISNLKTEGYHIFKSQTIMDAFTNFKYYFDQLGIVYK